MAAPTREVAMALRIAVQAHGPGTVRELAARAQVGSTACARTASRMVARGELVRLSSSRPAVLGLPSEAPRRAFDCEEAFAVLDRALAACHRRAPTTETGFDAL